MARHGAKGQVRELASDHPVASGAVAILLAIGAMVWASWPQNRVLADATAFYSADDGETFFEHPLVGSPFLHEGKTAYQAVVFTCDAGASRFVGYLVRYAEGTRGGGPMEPHQFQVKRPGPGQSWVSRPSPPPQGMSAREWLAAADVQAEAYRAVTDVTCLGESAWVPRATVVGPSP